MADGFPITPGAGGIVATDDCGAAGHVQLVKLAVGTDGSAALLPATAANGLDVRVTSMPTDTSVRDVRVVELPATSTPTSAYAYAAGTQAATIDIPANGRVRRVSVVAGTTPATITIAGGPVITVPANAGFDEQLVGDPPAGGDVVVGGGVVSYYVSWTV